jgi:hypothetical protein
MILKQYDVEVGVEAVQQLYHAKKIIYPSPPTIIPSTSVQNMTETIPSAVQNGNTSIMSGQVYDLNTTNMCSGYFNKNSPYNQSSKSLQSQMWNRQTIETPRCPMANPRKKPQE